MATGTEVDRLYVTLELASEKFDADLKRAEAQLAATEQRLGTALPNASTAAAASIGATFKATADGARAVAATQEQAAATAIAAVERVRDASMAASQEQIEATRARIKAEADALIAAGAQVDAETGRIRANIKSTGDAQAAPHARPPAPSRRPVRRRRWQAPPVRRWAPRSPRAPRPRRSPRGSSPASSAPG